MAYALFSFLSAGGLSVNPNKMQAPGGAHDYIIAGSVRRDDNDQPVSGIRVQLLSTAGNVVHSAVLTNASGEFSFGQSAPGKYEIAAEADGYQPVRLPVEISRFDQGNVIVRIRQLPSAAKPAGDVTSAHQLAIPQKARAAYEKGIAKADSEEDYKAAILDFQRAISVYPDYYEAYAEVGMLYVRLKDAAEAEKALRQSIRISDRKYPPPLILLSMLMNDQNRPAQAEPVARQLVAADPSAWRGPYELSRALLGLRRLSEAEANAYKARDLKPENPGAYLLLSEIHRHTQNPSALDRKSVV